MKFYVGDIVQMKKPHPCGANRWEVLRVGIDFRLRCTGCNHLVLIPRTKFEKRVKKILERPEGIAEEITGEDNL
ncbi:MAG: hypothetical protein PWP07_2218 [Epulopiscium sp.]|jgi:hypothetical protein|uniref:DUF951 family protein n=1 Tax=Defluviitalea raffinosedens TaxID=1450156 RepID=A0A7C8HGW0_9FIRM|nr:DUF951 domain-containing protein [Defluviitalea raffinosedens]KAE9632985.1 DUF951 family protein [Defluviitalea raffinosedens]MBZ4669640.1 hypothetical protein [Defluviitaleaceae bacterium]MDK2788973.1 hypothetical protein [Candidatus Epulonipiscium sp.]HHW68240.1 DUF951 family protein [Candidatus Epulonipiscium sp.]